MLTHPDSRHFTTSQSHQQATRMNDPSRVDAMAQVEDSANDIARIDAVLQEILRQRNIALQRMQTKSESAAQDVETAQTESNEHIEQYTDLEDL